MLRIRANGDEDDFPTRGQVNHIEARRIPGRIPAAIEERDPRDSLFPEALEEFLPLG